MPSSKSAAGLTLLLLAGGCTIIGSKSWFENRAYAKEALSTRASFDLQCPAKELAFAPLSGPEDYHTTGVTGCGKQASYVYVADRWVMNSDAKQR